MYNHTEAHKHLVGQLKVLHRIERGLYNAIYTVTITPLKMSD